jgi:DNA-binding NarL/FixJ family response regulator
MPARILLVDDHEIVRKGVRMLFTNSDSCEVCGEAENGLEAVRMVRDLSPDVVILDLSMPAMNGFETAAKIRQIAPSIKIIFFTVHELPASAWWVGADACVSKSSTPEELALTVNRVLQCAETFNPSRKVQARVTHATYSVLAAALRRAIFWTTKSNNRRSPFSMRLKRRQN